MMPSALMNEIEEREQENPDDVHEVPVKAHHFHRAVVVGSKITSPGPSQKPEKKPRAYNHVQGVKPGHSEIEDHEQLDLRGQLRHLMPREMRAWEEPFLPVLVVLEHLHADECQPEEERHDQHGHSAH